MRTLITNGTLVTAEGAAPVDVLVEDEQVVALATGGSALAASFRAGSDQVLDASGKYVLPAGSTSIRTWRCRSAAPPPPTPSRPAPGPRPSAGRRRSSTSPSRPRASLAAGRLDAWQAKAEGNCAIDYGFHMIVSDVNDSSLKEMDALVGAGSDQLQALHGLSGRVLRHRRRDPPGHAAGRRQRRHRHDARRERHRHRRHRGRRRSPGARPIRCTTA